MMPALAMWSKPSVFLRHPRALQVLFLALFLGAGISFLHKATSELRVYVKGAGRMIEGEEIYRPGEISPFTYPPFFALPFVPFTVLPLGAQRLLWYLVLAGTLFLSLRLLRRFLPGALPEYRNAGDRARALFWVVTLLLSARFVIAVFQNQSHDLLVLFLVLLAALASARPRDARSGAAAGLGAACKATPLLFLPLFLLQRRWRAALALVVVLFAATLLPDLVFPRADGGLWVASWWTRLVSRVDPAGSTDVSEAWREWNLLNQNLSGTIHRLSRPVPDVPRNEGIIDASVWAPPAAVEKAITVSLQLALLILLAWACRPARAVRGPPQRVAWRRFGEAAAIACLMLLLSPMSSKAHFCLVALAAVFAAGDLLVRRRDAPRDLLLLLAFLLLALTSRGLLGKAVSNQLLARGVVCWGTLALFLCTVRILTRGAEPSST